MFEILVHSDGSSQNSRDCDPKGLEITNVREPGGGDREGGVTREEGHEGEGRRRTQRPTSGWMRRLLVTATGKAQGWGAETGMRGVGASVSFRCTRTEHDEAFLRRLHARLPEHHSGLVCSEN